MADSTADRNNNLARVRDNQRRSRARRKEYLNDLETKYRHCEQVGVEASTAIQSAARRVVEENKKLRQLLRRKGVSDDEVERFLGEEDAGSVLESMLGVRWDCGEGGCGSGSGDGKENWQPSPAAAAYQVSPVHSASDFDGSPQHVSSMPTHQEQRMLLPQQTHPSNSTSSTTSSGMHTPSSGEWNHPIQPRSIQPAQQQPPTSVPNTSHPDFYPNLYSAYDLQPQTSDFHNYDSTSCHDVAGVLRALRPDMGPELENELGCGSDGRECAVPNTRAFDLLDRFSERLNAL